MSNAKLFILHEEIDKWMDSMEVDLQSDSISLPDLPGPMSMEPAIHVTRQVAGEEDTGDLVGKIMAVSRLQELGLEYFQGSVIAGDNAYEAVEGFMISGDHPTKEAAAPAPAPAVEAEDASPARDEAPTEIDIPLDPVSGLPSESELEVRETETPAADTGSPEDDKDASPEDMLARLILEKLK